MVPPYNTQLHCTVTALPCTLLHGSLQEWDHPPSISLPIPRSPVPRKSHNISYRTVSYRTINPAKAGFSVQTTYCPVLSRHFLADTRLQNHSHDEWDRAPKQPWQRPGFRIARYLYLYCAWLTDKLSDGFTVLCCTVLARGLITATLVSAAASFRVSRSCPIPMGVYYTVLLLTTYEGTVSPYTLTREEETRGSQ